MGDLIKRAADSAGLNSPKYSGHSLRSGHATQASRSGIAEHIIRRQTGHISADSLKRYVRLAKSFEENSANGFGFMMTTDQGGPKKQKYRAHFSCLILIYSIRQHLEPVS